MLISSKQMPQIWTMTVTLTAGNAAAGGAAAAARPTRTAFVSSAALSSSTFYVAPTTPVGVVSERAASAMAVVSSSSSPPAHVVKSAHLAQPITTSAAAAASTSAPGSPMLVEEVGPQRPAFSPMAASGALSPSSCAAVFTAHAAAEYPPLRTQVVAAMPAETVELARKKKKGGSRVGRT
jgi:hypothetical protein